MFSVKTPMQNCKKVVKFLQNSQANIGQDNLFQSRLDQQLNPQHPLFRLAQQIDWSYFEREFGPFYAESMGAPAIPTRLMVGLHYLKHAYNESDESVVAKWIENPYWQYFCGYEFFQHELPCHPTSLVKWRQRLKADGVEQLLKEVLATAVRTGALDEKDLQCVVVDTTVQEKAIAFPTDSRLYHKAREAVVDRGYRGQDHHPADVEVHIAGQHKARGSLKKLFKRRNAIEPVIEHDKHDHGLGRNHLKGQEGDRINALLSGCGFNLRKLLRAFSCALQNWLSVIVFKPTLDFYYTTRNFAAI